MSKFVVVVFPSESKAYEGKRALIELHAEGSLTVYGTAVIAKDRSGSVSVKEAVDSGPLGLGVGALIGGLVGVLGGPAGVAIGMGAGAVAGGFADLIDAGVDADFVDAVSEKLRPGKAALIAEVSEDWVTPLDVRMEEIGGDVIREWRFDFEDERTEKEIRELQAEVAHLKDEWKVAAADRKAKLTARIDEAQAKLDQATKNARERVHQVEAQGKAKISELQQQAAKAGSETKARIDQRIAATRAEYDRRTALLKQAGALTKQAFAA